MFGLKYQGGNWYRRTSKELCELFTEEEVVKVINISRLRWAGHVMRVNDNDPAKKVRPNPEEVDQEEDLS